jgi:tetratricopeptide (TPR) repeat protein
VSPADASAFGALERVAIANKNWELLTQVDSKLGAITDDQVVAAAHQTRLGETLELQGDPSALDTFRAALARDPENIGAARGLSRLSARTQDPALLAEAAGYVARVLQDPERAASLLVQSARVRYERMRDPASAAADLERALEICPDHADSAQNLIGILSTTGDLGRLTDLLSHAAGRAKTPARRAHLWVTVGAIYADRRGDVGAGLTALDRALKEQPGNVAALMKEAELYGKDNRASEAVDRLSRVVSRGAEPPVLLAAHLQLARLLDGELGQADRAVSSLKAVLGIDGRHREALAMLLDIETRQDKFKEAAETAAKLVEVCPSGVERADALTRLARLEKRRGNLRPALEAYRDAVALTGVESAALAEMRALFADLKKRGEKPPWDVYAEGLSRYLEHVRESDPRLAPAFLELGRVLGDELKQSDRAIAALRAGATRFSRDAALRTELAERLRLAGKTGDAAEELRRLVDLDPLKLDVWRDLAGSLKALGRADLANVAVELLVALGGGTDLERMAVEQRVARPAMLEAGAIDAETLRLLDAGTVEDQATSRLVAAASLGLERIYPPDFDAYGVSRGDRISSRSGHPTRLLADRLARVLGVGDFDFYVHQAHSGDIGVEFSDPVSILVPAHVAGLPDGHQAFLLARVLTNVARGLHPVDKLPIESLNEVIIAAMRTVDPNFGSGQGDPEYLDTFSRNLFKGLPRRGRRPLEEAAAAYGPSPKPRLDDWSLRVRKTAARVALLLSDDPAGAVGILRRSEGDLARLQGAALERGMAVIADSLRFAVSDIAATVRRRVGLG